MSPHDVDRILERRRSPDHGIGEVRDEHPNNPSLEIGQARKNGGRPTTEQSPVAIDPLLIIDMQHPPDRTPQRNFVRTGRADVETGRLAQI